MKYQLYLIIIIIFISCNNTKQKKYFTLVSITDNKNIFGQWQMCSVSDSSGMMTTSNVCSIITFNIYGTGLITDASGMQENFTWSLKNRTLKISHQFKKSNDTFSDTAYIISFEKETQLIKLQIQQVNNNEIYYLTKQLYNN